MFYVNYQAGDLLYLPGGLYTGKVMLETSDNFSKETQPTDMVGWSEIISYNYLSYACISLHDSPMIY